MYNLSFQFGSVRLSHHRIITGCVFFLFSPIVLYYGHCIHSLLIFFFFYDVLFYAIANQNNLLVTKVQGPISIHQTTSSPASTLCPSRGRTGGLYSVSPGPPETPPYRRRACNGSFLQSAHGLVFNGLFFSYFWGGFGERRVE